MLVSMGKVLPPSEPILTLVLTLSASCEKEKDWECKELRGYSIIT
jgi:hypothetical protein